VALSWFRRTLQLARRSGDWDSYVRAQVGISKMWYARGSFPRARRILQQALRVAQREGLDEALGMAYHELFIIASDSHHDRDAIRYAQAALRAYPPSSPNLPALAYDVAFFWVLRGEFAPALPVLKRVVPQMTIQTHGQGGLARTAGAMGNHPTFDSAWQVIWELDDSEPGKADALVEAARGALSLGRHDDAERAATRGLEIASARRQMLVVMDAEAILESLRSERAVAAQGRKPVPEPSDVTPDEASALLARDLLHSLETGPDEPGISEELPQPVATVLSRALRAVRRWAQTFRSEGAAGAPHGGDPEIAAGPDELTREPLLQEALAELSDRLSTGAADPEQVADACTRIADWAAERKAGHTAIRFAVAAAEVSPEPRPALVAARMARDRADYPTAETWYQEAVERAERLGDWDTYVRAYIGMGKMWLARGVAPLARSHLLKAVEIAQREGLSDATGMAYHDLFITAAGAHWDAEAIAYAGAAARTYWPGHRLLPSLAYDVAYYWVQRGQFARALPVLKAAVPHMVPKHQTVAQGGLARAAGNVGDVQTFDSAWQTLWALDDQAPYKADGLVEAARGATSLGRWDDADRAALRGREIASARGEMRTVFEAEAVLDSVRSKRRLEQRRDAEPVQIPVPQNLPADELVRDLVEALTAEVLGHR
jgi:tetratricopeptide (TPR) repeat protein